MSDHKELKDLMSGPVFVPGDEGYEAETAGFQTGWRRRPDVIAGVAGADDVRAAVSYAAARGLPVSVQATGHQVGPGPAGGLLVSTRRMDGVTVDPAARAARISAGAPWAAVIRAAAPHGLAPLSGSSPEVGAVSYVLGGGLGLLSRRYGYAADHVRSFDLVTADGEPRHVTADGDPDLFWALRGGGRGLGVVTSMEVDLVPAATIYGGGLYFPARPEVLDAYLRWTAGVPDEMTSGVGLIPLPDVPGVPEPVRGKYVAHVRIAYDGPAGEGERLVEPLRAIGPRLLENLREMPYEESGVINNDPSQPHTYDGTSLLLRGLDGRAARTILDLAGPDGTAMMVVVQINHLGGALARPPATPSAVGHRDAGYLLRVLSPLEGAGPAGPADPADLDAVRSTHRRLLDALRPWSAGAPSLNFVLGRPPAAEEVRAAYDPGDFERLTRIREALDPAGLIQGV